MQRHPLSTAGVLPPQWWTLARCPRSPLGWSSRVPVREPVARVLGGRRSPCCQRAGARGQYVPWGGRNPNTDKGVANKAPATRMPRQPGWEVRSGSQRYPRVTRAPFGGARCALPSIFEPAALTTSLNGLPGSNPWTPRLCLRTLSVDNKTPRVVAFRLLVLSLFPRVPACYHRRDNPV